MSSALARVARVRMADPATVLGGLSVLVIGGLAWRNANLVALACAGLAGYSLSGSP